MADLGGVVRAFADRPDVAAVVLVSGDGLPIQYAGSRPLDPDAAAALAATFSRAANALAGAVGLVDCETAVLETAGGLLIVARLDANDWLVVVPARGAEVGPLLYDLRRHRAALAALL